MQRRRRQQTGPPPGTPLAGPKRLIAYCCTCQQTIYNLPMHIEQFAEHRGSIRYMLVPDLAKRGAA